MTSWRFIGRSGELDILSAAAVGTSGRGLVVGGAAGAGKSWLLREGISALNQERFAVWTSSATAATAGLPFASFAHLLPAAQPPGLSPAGILKWAVDAIEHWAAGRPIVWGIDDIHLVDPLSAALINLIARSGRATVLATLRTGEPTHDSITALWMDGLVDRLELAPMSLRDTSGVLHHLLGGPIDPGSAERLHRLGEGNALMLRELALAVRTGGDFTEAYGLWRWTGRLTLTPTLTEVIEARIGQLSDQVRTVVELVALSEPLELSLIAAATSANAVEIAEDRQLIQIDRDNRRSSVRLVHPLHREVVRQRCPVTRSRRLLTQLATLVEETGARRNDDRLRIALWRLDAETATDPAELLAAGRQAFTAFDIPTATRLAHAAHAIDGGFESGLLLATILMFSDQAPQALAVLNELRPELSTGDRIARWHGARALVANWGLSIMAATDELSAAAHELDETSDRTWIMAFESLVRLHRMECDTSARLARAVLNHPDASPTSRGLARGAVAYLQALRGNLAEAAQITAAIEADATTWRDRAPHTQLALELARGTSLILAGDVAGVDALAATDFAAHCGTGEFPLGSGYLCVVQGQAARLRGRIRDAMRFQRAACTTLAQSRVFAGLANAERAHTAALAGEPDEAQEAMAEADRRLDPTMAVLYPWLEHARCWVRVSTGDIPGAVSLAHDLAARLRSDTFTAHEAVALHDVVRLGRPEKVVDRLSDLAEQANGLVPVMAAHAQAAVQRDSAGLLTVAERFADLGLKLYAAEAAATAYASMREHRCARTMEAARALRTLLNACDGPHTPGLMVTRPRLSLRESQIARLAALGVTSRDIAERLFLSTRTIDNHLRRVYAKLGVGGRGELATALHSLTEDIDEIRTVGWTA